MSGPWEKYKAIEAGPWTKYGAATEEPAQQSPGDQDQALANQQAATSTRYGEPIRTGKPQPPPGATISPYARERISLEQRGVSTGSIPAIDRLTAGYGNSDQEALSLMGYDAIKDPVTGRVLARRSATEPYSTITPPGVPDIAAAPAALLREIPAAIGGILGGVTGPGAIAVGALGAGAGAAGGEYIRQQIGKKIGVVPLEHSPALDAGIAGAGAAVFTALGGLGYTISRALAGRGLPPELKNLTSQQLSEMEAAFSEARRRVVGTPLEDTLRPSQVLSSSEVPWMQNLGDQLAGMESRILSGTGEARNTLAAGIRTQESGLGAMADEVAGRSPTITKSELGRAADEAATRTIGREIAAYRGGGAVGQARQDAQAAAGALEPAIQPGYTGGPIRRAVEKSYDAAEKLASQAYNRLRAGMQNERGVATATIGELQASKEFINRNLIPALTEEDRRIVEPTLRRLMADDMVDFQSGAAAVPGRPASREGAFSGINDVGIDDISTTLRAVRRELRRTFTGVATADVQQLLRIEKALTADRNAILGPQRTQELEAAEAGWRKLRDDFQNAPLVGRMLSDRPGGADAVEDFALGKQSLNPDNIRAIANALRQNNDTQTLDLLRQSLRYQARNASGLNAGRELDPNALQQWVNNNKPALDAVFSPQEINAFFNASRMQREYASRLKTMTNITKELGRRYPSLGIDKTMGGKYANPSSFIDEIIAKKNPDLARSAVTMLRRQDPTAFGEMEAWARSSLTDAMTTGGAPNSEAISMLLKDSRLMETYAEILGPAFQRRVSRLADVIAVVEPRTMPSAGWDPKAGFRESAMRLARALISPLSRTGRHATLLRGLGEESIAQRIANAMVDEGSFRQLVEGAQRSASGRASITATGAAIGAGGAQPATDLIQRGFNGR